jgi:hypothetical protein
MNDVLTYQDCFKWYPNAWVLLWVIEREKNSNKFSKGKVIDFSIAKQDILDKSNQLKKCGIDVVVICTLENIEVAACYVTSEFGLIKQEYVSAQQYAKIFNMYYGL